MNTNQHTQHFRIPSASDDYLIAGITVANITPRNASTSVFLRRKLAVEEIVYVHAILLVDAKRVKKSELADEHLVSYDN